MRVLVSCFLFVLVAACSLAQDANVAGEAVGEFHEQFNAADFSGIYRSSHQMLRQTTSEAEFVGALTAFHNRMGNVRSTRREGWHSQSGTSGRQTELTQESTYENGTAEERFIFVFVGDEPQLIGYHFNTTEYTGEESPPGQPAAAGK